jgi:hypothetical protein
MKKVILSVVAVLFTACQAITWAESPAPPVVAFDILKADIDLLLKNSPPAVDQQIRVVDMGEYNLGVGIIHRGPTNAREVNSVGGPPRGRSRAGTRG